MHCIQSQSETTPELTLSNPWSPKSICDPNQYQAAIERCESGCNSCGVFIDIFEQRVMIERDYVAAIHKWSTAAEKKIQHLAEFGTNKRAWLDSIRASELIAKSHNDIAEGIQRNVVDTMMSYERENYSMSILRIKIVKEFEKEFENIQKPWLKLLDKLERAKKSYHEACRKLKKAEAAENSRKSDTSASKEQKNDVAGADSAYSKELMVLRCEYKKLFDEMENSRPAYENSMKEILNRMNHIERQRLGLFKVLLNAFHDAVNIERNLYLTKMSTDMKKAIESHDIEGDLQFWQHYYASDAHNSWPLFEDPIE